MFVADLHNDLVQRVIEGEDVTKPTSHGHTDIPRLLKSEIDLEILIIWVSSNSKEPNFFKRADKMYDEIERISSHEEIVIPKKLSDINEAINNNGMSVCPCDVSFVTSSPTITLCTRSLCKSATNI